MWFNIFSVNNKAPPPHPTYFLLNTKHPNMCSMALSELFQFIFDSIWQMK